jgi:release factor glutamine methyltransferase
MTADRQDSWTILEILRWTTEYFREKGVSEPRASAEVLLAHALGLSRLDLYLRHDLPLTPQELTRFKALVVRRREGEPVAYLTGEKEFWSLAFRVTPGVLIPRPETEILVEAALAGARDPAFPADSAWGLEVGVGSGAVVVTLARELPAMEWVAVDLSRAALAVAQDNARRHEVAGRIRFLQADLLPGLKPTASFALVVANLPYVPREEWEKLPRDIRDFEPKEALVGGEDGLALIRPLARQAHHYLKQGGYLALEVGPGQAEQLMASLGETEAYDRLEAIRDYQGIKRVVRARRGSPD